LRVYPVFLAVPQQKNPFRRIQVILFVMSLKAPRERPKGLFPGSGAKKIWKKGRLNGNAIISIFPYGLSKQGFPEKSSSRYAIPLRSDGKPSFKTSPQTRMIFCTVNVQRRYGQLP